MYVIFVFSEYIISAKHTQRLALNSPYLLHYLNCKTWFWEVLGIAEYEYNLKMSNFKGVITSSKGGSHWIHNQIWEVTVLIVRVTLMSFY